MNDSVDLGVPSAAPPDFATVLLGILVMQDVLLGLIMALLPILAANAPVHTSDAASAAGPESAQTAMFFVYSMLVLKLCVGK